jgi:hypothetical protein
MRILAAIILTATCATAHAKEDHFRCKHDSSNEEISMAIKSEPSSTTIVIRSRDGMRTYFVSQSTSIMYKAETKNSEAPEAFSSIEIDRLSGDLRIQERISYASTKVLAEVCRSNLPVAECRTMMSKVSEADVFLCGTTADGQCPRWLAGMNTYRGAARYVCQPIAKKP